MFALGMLSLMQILYLPGSLLLRWWRKKPSWFDTFVIFTASLVSNYLLVFFLTALGIYRRSVLYGIFVIEAVLWIWLYREWGRVKIGEYLETISEKAKNFLSRLFSSHSHGLLFLILAFFAINASFWSVKILVYNTGSIFDKWDDVVSWNRWAVDWSHSQFPAATRWYSQLLPANWSITYLFIGDSRIQFFAKAIMPLFTLLIFVLFFYQSIRTLNTSFLIALILCQYLMRRFLGAYVDSGYTDLPLAFFASLTTIAFFNALDAPTTAEKHYYLWVGMLAAAGAALTKPNGLYIYALYPFLAYLILKGEREFLAKGILLYISMSIVLVLPWYGYKAFTIFTGRDESNLLQLMEVAQHAQNATGPSLVFSALANLPRGIKITLILFGMASPWIKRPFAWYLFLMTMPYLLLWTWISSYDLRNLSPLLVYLPLGIGLGVTEIFSRLRNKAFLYTTLAKLPIATLLFPILLAFLLSGVYFLPANTLLARQLYLQQRLFSPSKNQKLLAYVQSHPGIRIVTNYPLDHIPGLEGTKVSFNFRDLASLQQLIERPEIQYLLVPSWAADEIKSYLAEKIARGEFELIFDDKEWIRYQFIKIRKEK